MQIRLKQLFMSLLSTLFFLGGQAQAKGSELENSLLWKVSKKGIPNSSYLFGTIHIICAQDYFWTEAMKKGLNECSQLCLEMDLSNPKLMEDAASLMLDLSGASLRDYFKHQEDYDLVAAYIEDSLGQDMNMAAHLKPVALYLIYSTGLIKSPCEETVSYELKILEQAQSKQMPVLGLESLEEQMSYLETIPKDSIIALLISIAQGKNSEDDIMASEMIAAYKKQDLKTLNQILSAEGSKELINGKTFIQKRNQNWLRPITNMMQQQSTFFAVGAGHLSGIITLLRNQGYKVEAVQ